MHYVTLLGEKVFLKEGGGSLNLSAQWTEQISHIKSVFLFVITSASILFLKRYSINC
tara:strand:+ start:24382 stop:24552 length:171 start_codon:yes stop_codon:yes gene_type:complete